MPWESGDGSFYPLFAAGEGDEFISRWIVIWSRTFEKLIAGVNEIFRKRNQSIGIYRLLESYKTCIQLYDTHVKTCFWLENLNRVIGQKCI